MVLFTTAVNPLLEKFVKSYPKYHIVKFLIEHKLNRITSIILLNVLYWFRFKMLNRLELIDKKNLIIKKRDYSGEPILVVQNHSSERDGSMCMATWSHFGKLIGVFTAIMEFNSKNPFIALKVHFFEMIPIIGRGNEVIMKMVKRLLKGDFVLIFPEGAQPKKEYTNTGFVQECFTGSARVAYNYWQITGKKLIIQPCCTIGANNVFTPFKTEKKLKKTRIRLKFGIPFTLDFSKNPNYIEFKEKSHEIAIRIAEIWGQKKLIPNYTMILMKEKKNKKNPGFNNQRND